MAVIRMLKSYGSNVAGEVCGQPQDFAESLVRLGVAVFVTAAPVQAVTKEVKPTEEITKEVFVMDVKAETEESKGLFKKSKKKG
jgi:hypothetical protein